MKKILLGFGALVAVVLALPMLAAFEAHVVNVTATIENALSVPLTSIDFGTVFPQEHLDKTLDLTLSGSFQAQNRVNVVDYIIRQKPKCGITSENGTVLLEGSTVTGHVYPGLIPGQYPNVATQFEGYYVDCGLEPVDLTGDQDFGLLPSLCEYISKHPDNLPENAENDGSLNSFHQPFVIEENSIVWTDTLGRLNQLVQDFEDIWTIDLAVPCFGGHCAQDWADFVEETNPEANPDLYVQDLDNEHKVFGCDLWVEVNGVYPDVPVQ